LQLGLSTDPQNPIDSDRLGDSLSVLIAYVVEKQVLGLGKNLVFSSSLKSLDS